MVLRSEVVWVSNLRSYSGNGMEGVVCQRAEMCSVWRVFGFDGAYELVWVGMGRYGQSALSRPLLLP